MSLTTPCTLLRHLRLTLLRRPVSPISERAIVVFTQAITTNPTPSLLRSRRLSGTIGHFEASRSFPEQRLLGALNESIEGIYCFYTSFANSSICLYSFPSSVHDKSRHTETCKGTRDYVGNLVSSLQRTIWGLGQGARSFDERHRTKSRCLYINSFSQSSRIFPIITR
jgi:hypothetical protein